MTLTMPAIRLTVGATALAGHPFAATGALSDFILNITPTQKEGMPPMRSIRYFIPLAVLLVGILNLSALTVRAEPSDSKVAYAISAASKTITSLPIATEGVAIFRNRDVFTAEFPGIPFEDFGDTSASVCSDLTAIAAPFNSTSDNDCFDPGDILSGIEFRDNPLNDDGNGNGEGLLYVPPTGGGVTNSAIAGNHFTNTFEIILTPTADVVGLDLVTLFGEHILRLRFFDDENDIIYEETLPVVPPSGTFMGIKADRPIRRVVLFGDAGVSGSASEGVSGIFFASPVLDEISLDLTVGTNPNTCATTDSIAVLPNTEVTYCYKVTNNTQTTLSSHTLTDTVVGTILAQEQFDIAPGATFVLTTSDTPVDDDTNTAIWTVLPPLKYTLGTGNCPAFPDITATGTALNLADDEYSDVSLPMTFQIYDVLTTKILVSDNGIIVAEESDEDLPSPENVPIPTDELNRVIAPFWDDLDEETGNIYVGPYTFTTPIQGATSLLAPPGVTTGPINYFAVEWFNRRHFDGPDAGTVTFTTLLAYPGQGIDNYIVTCYADTEFGDPELDYGASATIGLNRFNGHGEQYSYNTASPELTGTFGVGYTVLNPGLYTATDNATVTVFNPDITVSPPQLSQKHDPAPQTTAVTLTLSNAGTDPLTWQLSESYNQCGSPQSVGWVASDVVTGTLPRGEATVLNITFDSGTLADGTYNAWLCVTSDDPDEPLTVVPVSFTVNNSPLELRSLYLPIARRR